MTSRDVGEIRRIVTNETTYSLAVSPCGSRILSGGTGDCMRLWDLESGKVLRDFPACGHVFSVAFSPDGQLAVLGSNDAAVVWDLQTGAECDRFMGDSLSIGRIAFSPDGARIVAGGYSDVVRIWDLRTGTEVACFEGERNHIEGVSFSPDGHHVLCAGWDYNEVEGHAIHCDLRLWDATTGEEVRRFLGHTGGVMTAAFLPDGLRVLSGGLDLSFRLWDVATGRELRRFEGHTGAIRSVAASPDGSRVLSASGHIDEGLPPTDCTVRLWNVETGEELCRFEGHDNVVFAVAFAPDGGHAVSGSADGTIRIWRFPPRPVTGETR